MEGGEPASRRRPLVPRLVPTPQVDILEALRWMRQPLSATQIEALFGEPGTYFLSRIAYHLRVLEHAGALEVTSTRQVGSSLESFFYFRAH